MVADYIARFDELMIRCNIDEEPVATLARFRAGLRPDYQRELILQEISTLEKAYRFATNMELYSSHAHGTVHGWSSTPETVHSLPLVLTTTSPMLQPPSTSPTTTIPPLPRPPPRLLLPPPSATPLMTQSPPVSGGNGNHARNSAGLPSNRTSVTCPLIPERPADGRNTGVMRPRPPPSQPPTANSRIACFKCQG